jgi:hypothetical protein
MIEIEKKPLEDWYEVLKPYQKSVLEQLVERYGEEKAAEEWITAMGPVQTATFGGDTSNRVNQKMYWNRLKDEFDKFICGHSSYKEEQEKLLSSGKLLGPGVVSSLATWIAPAVGMPPSIIAPALVLLLYIAAKISVKAYCATKNF